MGSTQTAADGWLLYEYFVPGMRLNTVLTILRIIVIIVIFLTPATITIIMKLLSSRCSSNLSYKFRRGLPVLTVLVVYITKESNRNIASSIHSFNMMQK